MIPIHEDNHSFDCCQRFYRRAILNTLIELKPKYILEIGTFLFQTSNCISYYFDKYMPDGKLITADISTWKRNPVPPKNVYPVMVYPHYVGVEKDHGNIDVYYPDYEELVDNSFYLNTLYIKTEMNKLGIDKFQLTFVDGGHTRIDIVKDLEIATSLTDQEGYILIDDINEIFHSGQYHFYQELKKNNNFYEFNGMGLIQNKELKIDNM